MEKNFKDLQKEDIIYKIEKSNKLGFHILTYKVDETFFHENFNGKQNIKLIGPLSDKNNDFIWNRIFLERNTSFDDGYCSDISILKKKIIEELSNIDNQIEFLTSLKKDLENILANENKNILNFTKTFS